MGSLVRATNLWGYSDLVRELGGQPEALLRRFHIRPGVEYTDDAFIAYEAVARMLEASAAELNCPDLGLRLSRWQGLDILGPIAVIARNAVTVLGAMETIARYLYVHSPALKLTAAATPIGQTLTRFSYEVVEPGLPYLAQSYELGIANGAQILKLLAGSDAHASAIAFQHRQVGPISAYTAALGCPVLFEQPWCGFDLPASLASHRIDTADPETRRIATKYLETNYLPSTAPLAERVAELVRRLLPTGECNADAIAEQLAMHPRTLQRRLSSDGHLVREVIERERQTLATRYLAEPAMPLTQIAGLLGYTEQSAFNRSCRRWFATTPRDYRAQLLSGRISPRV